MTRDEAHAKLMAQTRNSCTEGAMVDFIDMSIALGMLSLDERKTAQETLHHIVASYSSPMTADIVLEKLEAAGIKIA